jgi:succinate dehydrogenase/fumarate reductase cytochrome b subunit
VVLVHAARIASIGEGALSRADTVFPAASDHAGYARVRVASQSNSSDSKAKGGRMGGKLFIVATLLAIVYNLGAGLYYMMVDDGSTGRTVNALTRRIGLSVGLILCVMFGIWNH